MRYLPALLAAASLALWVAPAVLASGPTPAPSYRTEDVGVDTDPLVPYVAALLVTGAGLTVVGVVAMQSGRKPSEVARRRRASAWWPCPACGTSNAGDRDTCYACGAPRDGPPS